VADDRREGSVDVEEHRRAGRVLPQTLERLVERLDGGHAT